MTETELVAALDSIDTELRNLISAPGSFELNAGALGGIKVANPADRLRALLVLQTQYRRDLANIRGTAVAEPSVPGVDSPLSERFNP